MTGFKQFDVVKLVEFRSGSRWAPDGVSERAPAAGDVATIVDVYSSPEVGYELECVDGNGRTVWLQSFTADDVELELVEAA